MKPDWSTAPDWANYLAKDSNGQWYWFEKKPLLSMMFWIVNPSNDGKSEIVSEDSWWRNSLEEKPKLIENITNT